MPIATMAKCADHIFVCVGEVIDITRGSSHLEEIQLDLLAELTVTVSFWLLYLVLSTMEDDPQEKHD